MPDFAVTTAFIGEDRMSLMVKKLQPQLRTLGRTAERAFKRSSAAASQFKAVLGGMLISQGITTALYGTFTAVRAVGEEFVNFDQALTAAGAKFPEKIGRGTEAFSLLKKAAQDVGATTEFTAAQAAEGLDFMAMAGFSAEGAIASLPKVVNLATAANIDLQRASDIATDALGSFALASKDAGTQAQNLQRINDVFAQTVTSANVTLEHMFESMKDGGPVITQTGQSLESFAALVGAMGNAGIKGSKAGTTLKNALLRLAAPPAAAAGALEKLNIKVADSSGNMRDILDILEDFKNATNGMGNAQRSAALDAIFGKRAIAGVSAILQTGIPDIRKFREELEGAAGASNRMAGMMRDSLLNKLKVLKSSLIDLGFRVLEAFQDKFPGALDKAIEAVRKFDVKPIVEGIKSFVGFIKTAWQVFKFLEPAIWATVGAMMAYRTALYLTAAIKAVKFLWTSQRHRAWVQQHNGP
jgi:TP901 family phage tail tape measure protein